MHPADVVQNYLREETRPFFIGPMPIQEFFDDFLPWFADAQSNNEDVDPDFFSGAYVPKAIDEGNFPPTEISMYKLFLASTTALLLKCAELKDHKNKDRFRDPPKTLEGKEWDFLGDSKSDREVIGQLASCAVAHLDSSFRPGGTVQFLCWERGGVVVTEALNYIENPRLIADFFRQFDQLTPAQQRWDQTVSFPSSAEFTEAKIALTAQQHQIKSKENLKPRRHLFKLASFSKFAVLAKEDVEPTFYVGAVYPRQGPDSLVCRASRGSPVLNSQPKEINFLEDSWRIDSHELIPEGDIYRILHEKQVTYIIPIASDGDVYFQRGIRARYNSSSSSHVKKPPASCPADSTNNVPPIPKTPMENLVQVVEPSDGADESLPYPPSITVPSFVCVSTFTSLNVLSDQNHPSSAQASRSAAGAYRVPDGTCSSQLPPSSRKEPRIEMNVTITHLYICKVWFCGAKSGSKKLRLRCYTHYRSSKEMVTAIRDAIKAHGIAYAKAKILHRDISAGNIMIGEDGEGYLIDWDLSKPTDKTRTVHYNQTGTWPYISATLLQKPFSKPHTYADDLESFLHVTMHTTLLYSQTTYVQDDLMEYSRVFDEQNVVSGANYFTGGRWKFRLLSGEVYVDRDLDFPGRPALRRLFVNIAKMFLPIYASDEKLGNYNISRIAAEATLNTWAGGKALHDEFNQALNGAWPEKDEAKRIKSTVVDHSIYSPKKSTVAEYLERKRRFQQDQPNAATASSMSDISFADPPHDSSHTNPPLLPPAGVDHYGDGDERPRPGKRSRLNQD